MAIRFDVTLGIKNLVTRRPFGKIAVYIYSDKRCKNAKTD